MKLGTNRSEWLFVNKGSAQGSLMGPIPYNMFANDMMFILDDDIDIYYYADDNSLLYSGSNYENVKHKLLHKVNKVVEWLQGNHMKVNPDKFQCIVFGNAILITVQLYGILSVIVIRVLIKLRRFQRKH